jgi:hypothetical protein
LGSVRTFFVSDSRLVNLVGCIWPKSSGRVDRIHHSGQFF